MKNGPIEGDFLKDSNGIVFDVKGLVHPADRVIAFPRFVPDPSGNRKQEGLVYRKIYSLSARFELLEQHYPQYVIYDSVFDERLCEVPIENVNCIYKPTVRLNELWQEGELDEIEKDVLELLRLLEIQADVPLNKMGISGSVLVGLHTPDSDVDPVIYGTESCRKVYGALEGLVENSKGPLRKYSKTELMKLFQFRVRDTRMRFEDFGKTESRKVLQGRFKRRDYFLRFVKGRDEITAGYGAVCYKNVGDARVKAEIADDREAIFTPCRYGIENVKFLEGASHPIDEIASFRGRFCEQARNGEVVIAQGKVEHVMDKVNGSEHFRLLLGNRPSDYMILA